ncbi:UNVERIFIED_CONTAM: putative AC transposase [Sesamum radiatum]|uniref:AC transposase n=1 Tax=Sesamum radiatum TaxID=300843 RepID=A0AAW2KS01_SESRA
MSQWLHTSVAVKDGDEHGGCCLSFKIVLEKQQTDDIETNIDLTAEKDSPSEKTKSPLLPPPKKKQRAKQVEIVKKESKNVSEVWGHFTRLPSSNPPRAAYNYCGSSYVAHPRYNGTTALWAHLENSCKKYPRRKEKSQKTMHDFAGVGVNQRDEKGNVLNVKEIRLSLARMVIIDELPFKFVEGEGFRAYSRALEPSFEVPSRHTVARDCMKIFIKEKRKLKKLFKSERVCLTTDTWTSLKNLNYMCLTAHWIDSDWELQKRIINFCIVENHKGETIGKQIEECLHEWGIDKVCTITVDNASSNDRAIAHLKKKCKWKDVILNNDYMHMRCSAHIVNLIVKEGLEEQHESIMRVRNAVKYVRSSPARLKAFKRCVKKEKIDSKCLICLNVETRWNSTYLMLDAAEKFEKAFERLGDEEQKFI